MARLANLKRRPSRLTVQDSSGDARTKVFEFHPGKRTLVFRKPGTVTDPSKAVSSGKDGWITGFFDGGNVFFHGNPPRKNAELYYALQKAGANPFGQVRRLDGKSVGTLKEKATPQHRPWSIAKAVQGVRDLFGSENAGTVRKPKQPGK